MTLLPDNDNVTGGGFDTIRRITEEDVESGGGLDTIGPISEEDGRSALSRAISGQASVEVNEGLRERLIEFSRQIGASDDDDELSPRNDSSRVGANSGDSEAGAYTRPLLSST
jgi:hypothetical protein